MPIDPLKIAIKGSTQEHLPIEDVVDGIALMKDGSCSMVLSVSSVNFDLLSDPDHEIAEKYGVWGKKKFMGKEYIGIIRTTFIIGSDGKLKTVLDEFTTKNHHNEVLAYIEENLL